MRYRELLPSELLTPRVESEAAALSSEQLQGLSDMGYVGAEESDADG